MAVALWMIWNLGRDVGGTEKYGNLETPQMCIYVPLHAPPSGVSKKECYMFNQYAAFSIIVAVLNGV